MLAGCGWSAVPTYVTPGDSLALYGPSLIEALEALARFIEGRRGSS